jgi:hypothetical protein
VPNGDLPFRTNGLYYAFAAAKGKRIRERAKPDCHPSALHHHPIGTGAPAGSATRGRVSNGDLPFRTDGHYYAFVAAKGERVRGRGSGLVRFARRCGLNVREGCRPLRRMRADFNPS